jgi:cytochrome bd-type quinol oxidase subunit 2
MAVRKLYPRMENEFKPFFEYIINRQHWSKPVALTVTAVLLLLAALALRTILYNSFLATRQKRFTASWQKIEYICLIGLFIAGSVAGYFAFGQIFSALLSGGCFAFAGSGTTLQALTANEKNK